MSSTNGPSHALSQIQIENLQIATAALAAARSVKELADAVIAAGFAALGAEVGVFVRRVGDGKLAVVASRGGSEVELAGAVADAETPAVEVFRTGEPIWVEDPAELHARFQAPTSGMSGPLSAVAALPIKSEGHVGAAVMFLCSGRSGTFSVEERAHVSSFAMQAGAALARVLADEHETRTRQRLESLADLTSALATTLSEAQVAVAVIERGMQAMTADTCMLYRVEADRSLTLVAERGCSPTLVAQLSHLDPTLANPTLETVRTGRSLWVETDAEYHAIFPRLASTVVEGPRAKAFWSIPLIVEGHAIGVLAMGFYSPRRFLPDERVFIETFAQNAAQALRRAQLLASESQARRSLETTLRSIGDAVIATDAAGRITFLNPVAEQLTGWPMADVIGKPVLEVFRIVDARTGAPRESPVDRALREGVITGLDEPTALIARDGREVPIDDSVSPIRSDAGATVGAVLVFRDVSHKQREALRRTFLDEATAALAESLDYETTLARVARLAVPGLSDWCAVDIVTEGETRPKRLAVAHVDPAKIQYANELAEKYPPNPDAVTGVPQVLRSGRSELYPDIPDELLAAGCVDEEHLRIARSLALRSAMIVPLTARGRVLGVMTFVFAESGRHYAEDDLRFAEDLARRCAVAIDNARLYASEQRARQAADIANRSKDEFLAMVSHELRTPLNAIMGWAKLMSGAGFDEARRARAVETIERNATAMAELIEDLLDVARIIQGKMRLDVRDVDLALLVDAAVESLRPAAEAKGIRVVTVLDTTVSPMSGDPTRLQQIIWNLLSNAVKFSLRGGRVDVVLRRKESSAVLSVTDTGIGVAQDFLPHVFEPFRQQDASYSRSRGGLGLGLAISRQLAELHGGHIEVHSEGEGKGATFTFTLPISAVASPEARMRRAPASIEDPPSFEHPPQLRGLRVLIVDDEEDARVLVREILEACGCRVTAVVGVAEAIEMLAREKQDVLVSDIGMPDRDGYSLIRELRALPAAQGGDIPAAALTAYTRAEDRRRLLNAGFSMHIPKPVEPAELVAVVASLTRFRPAIDDSGKGPLS